MLKKYLMFAFIPMLGMAAGLGIFCFMVIWVQHECYNTYLENTSEIVAER